MKCCKLCELSIGIWSSYQMCLVFLFGVLAFQLEMVAADPLRLDRFYIKQDIRVIASTKPTLTPAEGCTISGDASPYSLVCQKSGQYVLTEGTAPSQVDLPFTVNPVWRRYRWAYVFFAGDNSAGYLKLGETYTLRIWVAELTFAADAQNELTGNAKQPGTRSKDLTKVFHGLNEFPVATLVAFDEDVLNMTWNDEGCYWEGEFAVNNLFLRRLNIRGHQISDMLDVVSNVDANLEYRGLHDLSSLLTEASLPTGSVITEIYKAPCYQNVAIVAYQDGTLIYSEDDFHTFKQFGKGKKITGVHLSPAGVYYAVGNQLFLSTQTQPVLTIDEPIKGVFGQQFCDFYEIPNSLSLENYVVGVYSENILKLAKDGVNFEDLRVGEIPGTFEFVAYQNHRISALVGNQAKNLELISFDISDPMPTVITLPSPLSDGAIAFSPARGFFCYPRTDGIVLLYTSDFDMVERVMFSEYPDPASILFMDFYEDEYVFTCKSNDVYSIYYGNINTLECRLLWKLSSSCVAFFDAQGQVQALTSTATGFVTSNILHTKSSHTGRYATIRGDRDVIYLDVGDTKTISVNISAISHRESEVRIVAPSFVRVKSGVTTSRIGCSSLLSSLYFNKTIPYDPMASYDTCMLHYIEAELVPGVNWISDYEDKVSLGRGSAPIEFLVSEGGNVFSSFNIQVVTGCPPRRSLGVSIGHYTCVPDEECRVSVRYGQKIHPIPLLFENGVVVNRITGNYALVSDNKGVKTIQAGATIPSDIGIEGFDYDSENYYLVNMSGDTQLVFSPSNDEVSMSLIISQSSETLCSLSYNFTVYVARRPLSAGYSVLAVVVALVLLALWYILFWWRLSQTKCGCGGCGCCRCHGRTTTTTTYETMSNSTVTDNGSH